MEEVFVVHLLLGVDIETHLRGRRVMNCPGIVGVDVRSQRPRCCIHPLLDAALGTKDVLARVVVILLPSFFFVDSLLENIFLQYGRK